MPSCDTCRIRKTRCDRATPCGSCQSSGFECKTSVRRLRGSRKDNAKLKQRSHAIIEPKRLADHGILKNRNGSRTINNSTSFNVATPPRTRPSLQELPGVSLIDAADHEHDVESPLYAHSMTTRDLLVQKLDDDTHVRGDPRMVAALDSLRDIVSTNKRMPSSTFGLPKVVGQRQSMYEFKLPPTQAVLDMIRKVKDQWTFLFDSPLQYVDRDQLSDLCKSVFFRTDDYPTSTAILVHGMLGDLAKEFEWSEDDSSKKRLYHECASLCRKNLETSISSLDMLLPATFENAQALTYAAMYYMRLGQATLCKRLAVHGSMIAVSLGWNRTSTFKNDSPSIQQQKTVMFWMLYVVDNNLALRLGEAPFMRDCDIGLALPWSKPIAPTRLNSWVNAARVASSIYQELCSPQALEQTKIVRVEAAQRLMQQLEDLKSTTPVKDDMTRLADFIGVQALHDATALVARSDEITYYALLCLVHRATPVSALTTYDPAIECIKYARLALDCHIECAATFKGESELWASYLHWTFFNTPFVPFTTVFSHVLTNHDRADLERLQRFAESMSNCPTSQAASNISRLASVFVNVAAVYIDLRDREAARNTRAEAEKNAANAENALPNAGPAQQVPMDLYPAWAPFDPLLSSLGFVDDVVQDAERDFIRNVEVEDWFMGNQHIMGLLEEDLHYLDHLR